jgi:hypothetical protein
LRQRGHVRRKRVKCARRTGRAGRAGRAKGRVTAGVLLQTAAPVPHMRYVEGAEDRHHVLLEVFYVIFLCFDN